MPPNVKRLPERRHAQPGPTDTLTVQRARPDVKTAPLSPSFALVDPDAIVDRITERVLDGIAGILRDPSQGERLLDDAGVRQVLQCSQPVLRGLLDAGLPHVTVGQMRRYRKATALAWLEARESKKVGKP